MKLYCSIIALLLPIFSPLMLLAETLSTEITISEMDVDLQSKIARTISVKIFSVENSGSGVIIARQNNTYLILTNAHVVEAKNKLTIITHDGVTHRAQSVVDGIKTEDDLALLEFSSNNFYQTASINTAAPLKQGQAIFAVGYSAKTKKFVTEAGKIERISPKVFKEGYQIGYSSNVSSGMSGGAILNIRGEVIGINGKSAFPIINTGYTYQDGTTPDPKEIEQLRQLSWGLSINRLLMQINPVAIAKYSLPVAPN